MNVQMQQIKSLAKNFDAEVIAMKETEGWMLVVRTEGKNYILRSARREVRYFKTLDAVHAVVINDLEKVSFEAWNIDTVVFGTTPL